MRRVKMKATKILSTVVLAALGTVAAHAAPASVFGATNPIEKDTAKGFAIVGIELRTANAPIANDSIGYTVTLHTLVGGNECVAAERTFQVSSQNADAHARTDILVQADKKSENACRELYSPAYADLQGYVATEKGYEVAVDTNVEGMGVLKMLGRSGTVIDSLTPTGVKNLGGNSGWVALELKARVLKGSNPCVAANNTLTGFGYALDGQLHVAVKSELVDADRFCTMEYNPVFADITFEAAYRPGSVKSIVIENFGEPGADKVIALPTWAP